MITLSIHSSISMISIAIFDNEDLVKFEKKVLETPRQSELLFGLLTKAMRKIQKLDKIIISRGPGSFTAIRSHISICQGLALVYNATISTVTAFEPFIVDLNKNFKNACILFKNSRRDFFFQFFEVKKNKWIKNSKIFNGDFKKILKLNNNLYPIVCDLNYEDLSIHFESQRIKTIIVKNDAVSLFNAHTLGYSKRTIRPLYHLPHYGKIL